jgi:hypothetical protein
VIEECRGMHREFVFADEGHPQARMNNSGWKAARRRAAARYEQELDVACPAGADISNLISAAEKVCDLGSRNSPALSIVRSGGASQSNL